MATQKTPAVANSTEDAVALRRLRKREQDRQCQRLLRERTRNRIAELEELVEGLSRQESNAEMVELMAKFKKAMNERDELSRTLRAVQTALGSHDHRLDPSRLNKIATQEDQGIFHVVADVEEREARSSPEFATDFTGLAGNAALQMALPPPRSSSSQSLTLSHEYLSLPQCLDGVYTSPSATVTCECNSDLGPLVQQPALWQLVNQTLSQREESTTQTHQAEEAVSDDTPLRALIEGWDAVELRFGGKLPSSWRTLREIDQTLFVTCGFTERLAILHMMYLQLRIQIDPSLHNQKHLPTWYRKRYVSVCTLENPANGCSRACASDSSEDEHLYCSNRFWYLFSSGFRILWPFEFRDCYSYNTHLNQYSLSRSFTERIADINAWTMDTCFFEAWPEFRSDVPSFSSIPAALPAKSGLLSARSGFRQPASQGTEWPADNPVADFFDWDVIGSITTEV
ncbi:hypothetical protein LTR36_003242 [Oleoguttula mirabilis]|uniref:BZIP transcription factor n=1 Tax=Oleoguttula mirabilis TaxID=1507867 RepID=A0AAV9JXI3_9PEZI|nr:hypothetical protein LTR36_003242 [Oleoguttula mirabilis]